MTLQGTSGRVEVEEVAREPITSDQQEAAIRADAPELEDLLGNLRNGLDEVRSVVAPLLKEVTQLIRALGETGILNDDVHSRTVEYPEKV